MNPIIYDGGAWPSELSGTSSYVLYSVGWNKVSQSLCVKEESPADFRTVTKYFGTFDSFERAYEAAEEAAQRTFRYRDDVLINSKEYNLTHLRNDPNLSQTQKIQLGLISEPLIPKEEERKESFWTEIRNDYTRTGDEIERAEGDVLAVTSIDAWKSIDDDKEGEVVARVLLSKAGDLLVDYIDRIAVTDVLAQEAIQEAAARLKEWYLENVPEKIVDMKENFFLARVKEDLELNYEDCYEISEEMLHAILSNKELLQEIADDFEEKAYRMNLYVALDTAVYNGLEKANRMFGTTVLNESTISEENKQQADYIRSLMVTSKLEHGFKNYDLFENHPDQVCYIPENWDFEFDGPGITGQDIIDQCGGDKIKARMVFNLCHWQFPSTVVGEWDQDDERALQELKASIGTSKEKGSSLSDKIQSAASKQVKKPNSHKYYHMHANPKSER